MLQINIIKMVSAFQSKLMKRTLDFQVSFLIQLKIVGITSLSAKDPWDLDWLARKLENM